MALLQFQKRQSCVQNRKALQSICKNVKITSIFTIFASCSFDNVRFSTNRQTKEDFQEDLLLDFADNERSTIFKVRSINRHPVVADFKSFRFPRQILRKTWTCLPNCAERGIFKESIISKKLCTWKIYDGVSCCNCWISFVMYWLRMKRRIRRLPCFPVRLNVCYVEFVYYLLLFNLYSMLFY